MNDAHDPSTRSFRPGEWFGIFGDRVTVVLPPSEKARVVELWALVDDGAGFDDALDALVSHGLRDLPGFVLVGREEDETRVLVRGAARASFTTGDETVVLDGQWASTWVERTLSGVTRMALEVGVETGSTDLGIGTGLVRLSRVDEPARSGPGEEPAATGAHAVAVEPVPDELAPGRTGSVETGPLDEVDEVDEVDGVGGVGGVDEVDEVLDDGEPTQAVPWLGPDAYDELAEEAGTEPVPEPVPEPGTVEDVDDPDAPDDDLPIWVPRPPTPPAPPAPPFGPPVTAPPAGPPPSGPPPVGPPSVVTPDVDHDGLTRTGGWDTGGAAAGAPATPSHAADAGPVARLVLPDGEIVDVDRAVLVGRAPEARRGSEDEEPRLVAVPSPHQEISSTHLEVRPGSGADHGSAVVTDVGSTNGTVLARPGLPPEDLRPGVAVQLVPGAVIDLGDGVTIRVTNP